MELNLTEIVKPDELEKMAARFRENLGSHLTEDLQHHLNDVLGPDVRVGIRVVVDSVSLRKLPTGSQER